MKRVTNTMLFINIICCLSVICYKYYNYFVDEKLNYEIQSLENFHYIFIFPRQVSTI